MAVALTHHHLKQIEPVHLTLIQVIRVLNDGPSSEGLRLAACDSQTTILSDLCDFIVFILTFGFVPALQSDLVLEFLVETER